MAMKRLVVCCDGSWNDSDRGTDYTNVARFAWSIKPVATDGTSQIVYYQSGVGTEGTQVSKIIGGATGAGLSHNMRDAYSFICTNYCEGDEIFLFGFSRGAYTARCIGGLIGFAGLIGKRDLDQFQRLWQAYKEQDTKTLASFETRKKDATIKCIGVWDTVGSLGIPEDLDRFGLFKKYYGFLNASLGEHVEHAFHALALDEHRKNFVPTLWEQTPAGKAKGQELKQVWFAGVHCDVGGGYAVHGAADIPLAWMASEVSPYLDIDFAYLKLRRDLSEKWSLGQLHESFKGFFATLPQQRREPLQIDPAISFQKIHASVTARTDGKGLAADGSPYASVVLKNVDVARNSVALSPLENSLKWAESEVKPGTESKASIAAKTKQFFEGIPGWFGITI
jgi:uncharacterized protein (DUF2235 family)